MKQFIVDRHTTPGTPRMEAVPTEKIKIYSDEADAVADLANIAENEIIATDAGDSQEGVTAVTDEVEEGNPLPISSSGMYDFIRKMILNADPTKFKVLFKPNVATGDWTFSQPFTSRCIGVYFTDTYAGQKSGICGCNGSLRIGGVTLTGMTAPVASPAQWWAVLIGV